MSESKSKSFWKRPEGVVGIVVLVGLVALGGTIIGSTLGALGQFIDTTLGLTLTLMTLGVVLFAAINKQSRTLISYMYKSVMRWITGIFIEMDPIAILKGYMEDLKSNLKKMNRQITQLRGQMHKLKELILNNKKQIEDNLKLAAEAREAQESKVMILKSRKAGRLKDSNIRLEDLYKRMEVLYRVLFRMHENSEIMMEDIQDQVMVKEQERKAIRASHGAMKSAMNIIKGNNDKRQMFDQALEAIADDVSQKVGEMERFMQMSEGFMDSIDLRNGIFEEEGLAMLEKWEKEGSSLLLGEEKATLLLQANDDAEILDLDQPLKKPEPIKQRGNQYDSFFE